MTVPKIDDKFREKYNSQVLWSTMADKKPHVP